MSDTPVPGLDSPPTSVEMDSESLALLEQLTDLYREAYRNGQALNSVAEMLRGCREGYEISAGDLYALVSPWTESVNTLASDFFCLCKTFSQAMARPSEAAATVTLTPPPDLYGDDDNVVPIPRGRSPQALVQAVHAWVDARCAEGAARLDPSESPQPG